MRYQIIKPDVIQASMMSNTEMIKQFLALYLQQTPVDFQNLSEAVIANDRLAIAQFSHHIKPTMEYIGASTLRHQFQELENLAGSEANFDTIQETFYTARKEYEQLLQELAHYLANLQ